MRANHNAKHRTDIARSDQSSLSEAGGFQIIRSLEKRNIVTDATRTFKESVRLLVATLRKNEKRFFDTFREKAQIN